MMTGPATLNYSGENTEFQGSSSREFYRFELGVLWDDSYRVLLIFSLRFFFHDSSSI
jgi:hypothetical protein